MSEVIFPLNSSKVLGGLVSIEKLYLFIYNGKFQIYRKILLFLLVVNPTLRITLIYLF